MPRRYFETKFVIGDRTVAEFLQNRNNWDIVNAIIDAGIDGITSKELSKSLKINYKTVADTTKHLSQMEYIISEPPKKKVGRPSKEQPMRDFRKPAYLHVWNYPRSIEPIIEEEFEKYCTNIINKYTDQFKTFVSVINQIIIEMKDSEFYPKEKIHDECGWSHEGYEFIKAIQFTLMDCLEDNSDFQAILKKKNLAENKAFEE